MKNFFLISLLLVCISSCKQNNVGKDVELYLLSSYQFMPGRCQVDSSTAILQNTPLIKNDDIFYYTRASYQYTVSASVLEKVKQLTGRTPFAISVNKKVIFYGVYMPAFLSSTCFNSITMAQSWDQTPGIFMTLGYPGSPAAVDIDDQRNNSLLIASLRAQGKLR